MEKVCLASDNWSPAHPSILAAIAEANQGHAPAYGGDPWTQKAQAMIEKVFKRKCRAFFVPTGTGANILAFRLACRSYESVICSDMAHPHTQETGAAEAIAGCKLLTVPHHGGKLRPEAVLKRLSAERAFGKHSTSPRVLSLTQSTEVGSVYSLEELKAFSWLCREQNLFLHMDGSRLYNAAVSLGVGLDELIHWVDLLSLGGTKNGLLGAEALLIFNPELDQGADHLHKQSLSLLSKMRYLSAQYLALFHDDLWHHLAREANQRAKEIGEILQEIPGCSLSGPVETNQVFFTVPASWNAQIQEKIFCYLWNAEKNEFRLVTSWDTSEEDVEKVRLIFKRLT